MLENCTLSLFANDSLLRHLHGDIHRCYSVILRQFSKSWLHGDVMVGKEKKWRKNIAWIKNMVNHHCSNMVNGKSYLRQTCEWTVVDLEIECKIKHSLGFSVSKPPLLADQHGRFIILFADGWLSVSVTVLWKFLQPRPRQYIWDWHRLENHYHNSSIGISCEFGISLRYRLSLRGLDYSLKVNFISC